MPGLEEKAKRRGLGEKRKTIKLIIGDATPSTSSFVQEGTIKLDPKVKTRGQGRVGVTIGRRKRSTAGSSSSVTSGMGGRH